MSTPRRVWVLLRERDGQTATAGHKPVHLFAVETSINGATTYDARVSLRGRAYDALVAAVRDAELLRQARTVDHLQARLVSWHEERFPQADPVKVALKLNEEAGEVASAVLGLVGSDSATGKGDVAEECGDVLIAILVLLGRWFPHVDVVSEAFAKLDLLSPVADIGEQT